MAGGSVSGLGTGGMSTKIEAASIATMSGIDTVVMSGAEPANIGDLLKGGSHGTLFRGSENPVLSRKMWIVACKVPSGSIFVDSGAAKAILERGSSLLPSGIKKVEGEFGRREVVSVRSLEGKELGRGITRYSSKELSLIMGHHSDEFEKILGYECGSVAVHRDDLAVSEGI